MRQLGQAWNSTTFYGVAHKITRQSLDEVFSLLEPVLSAQPSLTFSLVENGLLVEGKAVDLRNAPIAAFAKRLGQFGLDNFDLVRGFSRQELQAFFEILGTPPDRLKTEGSIPEILSRRGLAHVQVRVASFQRITDSDVVLKKEDLMQELSAAAAAGSGETSKSIEQIVAFLKGGTGAPASGGESGAGTKEGAGGGSATVSSPETDAGKLAELILSSTEIRAAVEAAGGESLMDLVVGSLRRQVADLFETPAARTKQGKKNIAKTLLVLEKALLDRLRDMAGGAAMDTTPLEEAFEEAQNDLAADSLASDYMKKRAAMEAAEKKVVRFLKRNAGKDGAAEAALHERLLEEGLKPGEWKQLQVSVKPPARDGTAGGGSGIGAGNGPGMEMLVNLLAEMDTVLLSQKGDAEERRQKIEEIAEKIDRQAGAVADSVEKHLDDMAAVVDGLTYAVENHDQQQREMSRRRLLEVLAEVVQELFQPLSVINAAVEMLLARHLGAINEEQAALLRLSNSNGQRLAHLADRLRSICGNPAGRTPDGKILDKVYAGASAAGLPQTKPIQA
jgi:hypothetical protein